MSNRAAKSLVFKIDSAGSSSMKEVAIVVAEMMGDTGPGTAREGEKREEGNGSEIEDRWFSCD